LGAFIILGTQTVIVSSLIRFSCEAEAGCAMKSGIRDINPIEATNLAVDFFNLSPWFFVYLSKSLSVGSDIIRSQKIALN
jgi:hypothetical protein